MLKLVTNDDICDAVCVQPKYQPEFQRLFFSPMSQAVLQVMLVAIAKV